MILSYNRIAHVVKINCKPHSDMDDSQRYSIEWKRKYEMILLM